MLTVIQALCYNVCERVMDLTKAILPSYLFDVFVFYNLKATAVVYHHNKKEETGKTGTKCLLKLF